MNIDVVAPLITGMFLGGIITEIRWIRRFREFQRQLDLSRSAESRGRALAEASAKRPEQETVPSLSLRSLQDHLAAEAKDAPVTEPSNAGKHDQ